MIMFCVYHLTVLNYFILQETSSKCFGSSKTSRMSFIDLAGLDRNKVDDSGRQCAREDKYVKKSLSRLGYDSITFIFHQMPYC